MEKKWSYGECPVCGEEKQKQKQKLKHLICRECFGLYTNDVSRVDCSGSGITY